MKKISYLLPLVILSIISLDCSGDHPEQSGGVSDVSRANTFSQYKDTFFNIRPDAFYETFMRFENHNVDSEKREESFGILWRHFNSYHLELYPLVQLGFQLIRNFNDNNIRYLIAQDITDNSNLYSDDDLNEIFDLTKSDQEESHKYYIAAEILERFVVGDQRQLQQARFEIFFTKAINILESVAMHSEKLNSEELDWKYKAITHLEEIATRLEDKEWSDKLSVKSSNLVLSLLNIIELYPEDRNSSFYKRNLMRLAEVNTNSNVFILNVNAANQLNH